VATALSRYMSKGDMKAMMGLGSADRDPSAASPRLEVIPGEQGAATSVWGAVSDKLAGLGGLYLADCAISENVAPYAVDAQRAEQLWTISERLCVVSRRPSTITSAINVACSSMADGSHGNAGSNKVASGTRLWIAVAPCASRKWNS